MYLDLNTYLVSGLLCGVALVLLHFVEFVSQQFQYIAPALMLMVPRDDQLVHSSCLRLSVCISGLPFHSLPEKCTGRTLLFSQQASQQITRTGILTARFPTNVSRLLELGCLAKHTGYFLDVGRASMLAVCLAIEAKIERSFLPLFRSRVVTNNETWEVPVSLKWDNIAKNALSP